ncbi:MAG TPA: glycosyl hydrolase family 65 protein [Burkholderiales bacterium]|nr:glycosyl hydrolase family 65 protein [Burkholderiales bacterium]
MPAHERIKPPPHDYVADEWNWIERRFHPEFMAQTETILALGNGYLGMRGSPEEGGPVVQYGTFVNGFHETWPIVYGEEAYGFARTGQTMLSVTDGRIIKLFVDDEPFWLASAHMLRFDRRLNMRAGTLDREVLWETPGGKQVLIRSRRLISFEHRHAAAILYEVTLLNARAPVVLSSEVLAERRSEPRAGNDPRRGKNFAGRVLQPRTTQGKDMRVLLCHGTERTKMTLACGIDHRIETECRSRWKPNLQADFGQVAFTVDAEPGKPIRLEKFIAYHSSATASPEQVCGRVAWTLDRIVANGFDVLAASQQRTMDDFWRRSDVQVQNVRTGRVRRTTVEVQQAIRFNLFHILQAAARADNTGVPAKGLTGSAYEGQYFWDTEIYVLPFLIYTSPRVARNLLLFRYRMLDKARERARELNHRGALFPWRTISGEEASAYYAAGTAQYHINADIMYALRKYVHATGDEPFLEQYGAEMLIETARFWVDIGFFSERRGGRFCINGVTGPDEYTTVVNNNTYTNLMARENLRYAAAVVERLRASHPESFDALLHKTGLEASEVEDWKRAAHLMFVPYDSATGIYPQDDTFLDREPWDFEGTPADKYPLLLNYHPLNIYRRQVIKQTDVILAMFLLGHEFTLEEKRRNFLFYDPLTTGDSSLSSCVEAIVATEIGEYDKAIEHAMAALLMDLADVSGNVHDGVHIASMGGTWMMWVYGFAGMRDYDGALSFRPHRAPEPQATIRFPLTYRGQMLEVEIGIESTTYTLLEGDSLTIRHQDEPITLTRETPRVARPNLGR